MFLGYNTNGFAFHRFEDAIDILHELGYRGVGISLDHHVLDPFDPATPDECVRVAEKLRSLGMRCVVETGARFLLDPRRKHQPTLLSPTTEERQRRIDFLVRSIRLAALLGADAVSFWSGRPLEASPEAALLERLEQSLLPVLEAAETDRMRLALEPEPGMFLDTVESTERFFDRAEHPLLGLTIDIGHLHCQSEGPIPEILERVGPRLWNVHIEDMRRGVHDHLMFGEGEIDFPPILAALTRIGYPHGIYVELSRHAHDAVETARRGIEFLRRGQETEGSDAGTHGLGAIS